MNITPENEADVRRAILLLVDGILDAVKVGGRHGAPGGVLYAALLGKLSHDQFEMLMSALVQGGKLTKRGQLYFAADAATQH